MSIDQPPRLIQGFVEGPESAKEVFEDIIHTAEQLQAKGDTEGLREYAHAMYERHFSFSPGPFNHLSLEDHLTEVMRINQIDALQGPIGQKGIGELMYRLAGFQYSTEDAGKQDIHDFIHRVLEDKPLQEQINILIQLQPVAADALANGGWAEPVYDAIQSYLASKEPGETFIETLIKERLHARLKKEETEPTMSFATTIDNQHKSLMFEESPFDEALNERINNHFSFRSFEMSSVVRVAPISRDYVGLFDSRNRLTALAFAKDLTEEEIARVEKERATEKDVGLYHEATGLLRDYQYHVAAKAINMFSLGVFEVSRDTDILAQIAHITNTAPDEIKGFLEAEYTLTHAARHGDERDEVLDKKAEAFWQILPAVVSTDRTNLESLEDAVYARFNKLWEERKTGRVPIETLELANTKELDFLGIDKENVELFKILQDPSFARGAGEALGVSLGHLDLRAQTALLSYFARATEKDVDHFSSILAQFDVEDREKACAAYLAFEKAPELGYIVERLCENPEIARPIMRTIYDLIGNAGKIEDFLLEEFQSGKNRAAVASVYDALIERAQKILLRYNAKQADLDTLGDIAEGTALLETYDDDEEEREENRAVATRHAEDYSAAEQELINEARGEFVNANADQALFLSAFRLLKERGELRLEDIRNTSLETESGAVFAERSDDVEKVRRLMHEAYKHEPDAFRNAVTSSFEGSLSNPDARFYVLRRKDELLTSLRFDDVRDEGGRLAHKYFGSFVSDPGYGNGKLGETVFEKALQAEAADGIPIEANCNPLSPITQKYVEAGFIANKMEDFSGVPSFAIRFDQEQNRQLETKRWSPEHIISAALAQNTDRVQTFSASAVDEIPFDLVNEGYGLTRYLKLDKRYYAVFERLPEAEKGSA